MAIGKHVSTMGLHGTTYQLQSFIAKTEAVAEGAAGRARPLAYRMSTHKTHLGRRVTRRLRFAIVQLAVWLYVLVG